MTPDDAVTHPDSETQWRTQTYVTGAPQLTARAVVVGMLVFGPPLAALISRSN